MKIIIGCDEAGYDLKEVLREHLMDQEQVVVDIGVYDKKKVSYPDIAYKLCKKIVDGTGERGILVCGTGIGMAITANKIPGIRAAVGHDLYSVERLVKSNNCQVLCMGARVIAPEYAKRLVDNWMRCEFVDGRSTPKIQRIMDIEQKYSVSKERGGRNAEDHQ